jgi:hypothetical protein
MTEAELIEIAEGVSAQRLLVETMKIMNTPSNTAERVKLDARYMVEQDKLRTLQEGYQAALRQFTQRK